jgi:hypothetical protein
MNIVMVCDRIFGTELKNSGKRHLHFTRENVETI